jgi:hypothetical protein
MTLLWHIEGEQHELVHRSTARRWERNDLVPGEYELELLTFRKHPHRSREIESQLIWFVLEAGSSVHISREYQRVSLLVIAGSALTGLILTPVALLTCPPGSLDLGDARSLRDPAFVIGMMSVIGLLAGTGVGLADQLAPREIIASTAGHVTSPPPGVHPRETDRCDGDTHLPEPHRCRAHRRIIGPYAPDDLPPRRPFARRGIAAGDAGASGTAPAPRGLRTAPRPLERPDRAALRPAHGPVPPRPRDAAADRCSR